MDISASDILKDAEGVIHGLTEGQKFNLSRDAERDLGMRSTYYLARYILGYTKLSRRFHVALCRHYDKHLYDLQLHLHPRKHYKTTLITIAGKIRLALLDPNITICIIANTLNNSQTFLKEIRAHFIGNEKFRDLYPEHAVDKKREEGTVDRFTTPARTTIIERMETFEAASADRALVSRHYKLLSFDDFVDDKNTATPELNAKLYDNYATSLSVTSLTKKGLPWHHVVGTRWNFDDPYQRILDRNKVTRNFQVLITQAYYKKKDIETGETYTEYLFPEEFPPEALDELRSAQGAYKFSCLYLNDPVPEGEMALNPDDLVFYDDTIRPLAGRNAVITVDPASSVDSRRGDPTVIGVYEIDHDSNIYIREIRRGWWNPDEIINQMLATHKLYKIRNIAIEAHCFAKWICFYLEKRQKEEGFHFHVIQIKRAHSVSKTARLERIQPYLRAGKIHVRKDEPEYDQIKRELREYPFGRYDDILDTLADAIEALKPPARAKYKAAKYRMPPIVLKGHGHFQTGYSYRSGC